LSDLWLKLLFLGAVLVGFVTVVVAFGIAKQPWEPMPTIRKRLGMRGIRVLMFGGIALLLGGMIAIAFR
jgi:hypothetical protein